MASDVLSLRRQSELHDDWLTERLDTIVPLVMDRAGIDCWVLVAREYCEDPVMKTMLPATWITARRRTILVFSSYGSERAAIARYGVGSAFPSAWAPDDEPDQWARLADYLDGLAPDRIAINRSDTFALADGMTATETEALFAALPPHLAERVVSTDELAIGWLETRSPSEIRHYPDVCARAHGILRRALSDEVIIPDRTTTADVEWWLRHTVDASGYRTWFHPAVSVQRPQSDSDDGFSLRPADDTIRRGDLIHIDFGIEYLGLHTDQQQHAYVLQSGEASAPQGLRRGMAAANRFQDIVMGHFAVGATGNEILTRSLADARSEGLRAAVYSHPIGLHGHGAGPTIGLWDSQEGVPGAGDYPVWPHTAFSIELSVLTDVSDWQGQPVRFMLEEDALFDGDTIEFLDGRQTELWLI